jgi:AcrR family transcriptional regulator
VEIKERILIKSQEMYFARGVRSVTMDDIATELGISKKTIYMHFVDKGTLVEASTIFFLKKQKCQEKETFLKAKNSIDEIILNTQMMREMLGNINPVIFHDLQKFYPKAWNHYLEHKKNLKDDVLRNLDEGIKEGYYRVDIQTRIMAKLRIESVDMAFNQDLFPAKEYNLLDIQLAFIDHFIRGIVTDKGLKAYESIK